MKFVTNLFQGKEASLEEGPAKYRPIDEYLVLHRDEGRTSCGKFVQTVKVILGIELIILIGWLGYVSFSYYNTDGNTDCEFILGCNSSKIIYDNIEMEKIRSVRSIEATEDGREKCERIATTTKMGLENLAAQFVPGEPSDPAVLELRQNFTELTISVVMQAVVLFMITDGLIKIETVNERFMPSIPDDQWRDLLVTIGEKLVNLTDPQNRQRLKLHDSPTEEMTNQFRNITGSLYIRTCECDTDFTKSFLSHALYNHSDDDDRRRKRELEPITECWSEDDKILTEERLARQAAYALRLKKKEADDSYWRAYLKGIEAALDAASISEIHFEPNPRKLPWLTYVESLSENSSLEVRKEGYALIRDLYIEFYKLKNDHPEWAGYDLHRIINNLTAANFFSIDFTKRDVFNDIVKYSNVFDLRYEELVNRESGADSNKPVFGKFTYIGEEPEKLGIRQVRHILDAFVKLYFKTQYPSSVCKGETPTMDSIPGTTNAKCWNTEQDPALLEERRNRVNACAICNEMDDSYDSYFKNFLDAIEKALNARSPSEIYFDETFLRYTPALVFIKNITMNASLELYKEGLEIVRDLNLEFDELKEHTSKWEGWEIETILKNMTETLNAECNKTGDCGNNVASINPEMIFSSFCFFGGAFNMRYEEIENADGSDKTDTPVLGKFTYLGEKPEQLGVRHIRHILDGLARFYFKVRHPSIAPVCNSRAEGGEHTNTGQSFNTNNL